VAALWVLPAYASWEDMVGKRAKKGKAFFCGDLLLWPEAEPGPPALIHGSHHVSTPFRCSPLSFCTCSCSPQPSLSPPPSPPFPLPLPPSLPPSLAPLPFPPSPPPPSSSHFSPDSVLEDIKQQSANLSVISLGSLFYEEVAGERGNYFRGPGWNLDPYAMPPDCANLWVPGAPLRELVRRAADTCSGGASL